MTHFRIGPGERPNLVALIAVGPLLSYYVSTRARAFAEPMAVFLALLAVGWLGGSWYTSRFLSGKDFLVVLSLLCLGVAPYAGGLFWVLLGSALILALLLHDQGDRVADGLSRSMLVSLRLAILPPIYYYSVAEQCPSLVATVTAVLLLMGALLCGLRVARRTRGSWLLAATELSVLILTITSALEIRSMAIAMAPWPVATYFLALHFLAAEVSGA